MTREPGVPRVAEAFASFATGVTLVTVADGRDDVGATVTAFCPISLSPPTVLISLTTGSYLADVLAHADDFAVTILAAGQRSLAGRFAAAGRPSARHLLDDIPHTRGTTSRALIPTGAQAALECTVTHRIAEADHLLVIASVQSVLSIADENSPLIRFAGAYPSLR